MSIAFLDIFKVITKNTNSIFVNSTSMLFGGINKNYLQHFVINFNKLVNGY